MRLIHGVMAVATLAAAAGPALADPGRLTDTQYIAANRCLGLMTSKSLGTTDAAAMRRLINQQGVARESAVYDEADQAQQDARIDASRGGAENQAKLAAERDGLCRAFLNSTTAAASSPGHTLQ